MCAFFQFDCVDGRDVWRACAKEKARKIHIRERVWRSVRAHKHLLMRNERCVRTKNDENERTSEQTNERMNECTAEWTTGEHGREKKILTRKEKHICDIFESILARSLSVVVFVVVFIARAHMCVRVFVLYIFFVCTELALEFARSLSIFHSLRLPSFFPRFPLAFIIILDVFMYMLSLSSAYVCFLWCFIFIFSSTFFPSFSFEYMKLIILWKIRKEK